MISINTYEENRNFIFAKSKGEEPYVNGPITINEQETFWILVRVKNEGLSDTDVTKNARVSIRIDGIDKHKTIVTARILCDNAEPVESSIEFNSENSFRLESSESSAHMYSQAYGLRGENAIKMGNGVFTKEGALIGFKKNDGFIPGGEDNLVTMSILVRVVRLDVNCVYVGHSGFYFEFPKAILIFDLYKGNMPPVRGDKELYVFMSHIHKDHFHPGLFDVVKKHPHAEVFLGYDHSMEEFNEYLSGLTKNIEDKVSCFDGEQKLISDNGELVVYSLRSTDMGVAFLIEYDGKTIFHAGDLAYWQSKSRSEYTEWYADALLAQPGAHIQDYQDYVNECEREFNEYTEPLRGKKIDYGMIPTDPRFDGVGYKTVKRYMEIAEFENWSPMHLWDDYGYVDRFVSGHLEYCKNMIAVTNKPGVKKQIEAGKIFNLW